STVGALILGLGILIFVVNLFSSIGGGKEAGANPWNAGTLEWATSSPPQPYNFNPIPAVQSRYPLWNPARDLDQYQFEVSLDRRETLGTTIVDAKPEQRVVLPGPTLVPLF